MLVSYLNKRRHLIVGCSKKIRRIFYTKIAISSFSDDVIVKTDSNRKKGKIKTNNIEIKME